MSGTLILPAFLINIPGEPPKEGWGARVVGDRVVDVARNATLLHHYPDDRVIQARDQVLAPGFVDAHTHLYGVLAHGIPLAQAPSGFWSFLTEFWWPMVEDRLNTEMICAATDIGLAAMLRGGTTTCFDVTEAPNALPGCLAAEAQVVRKRGMRCVLSFEATERASKENGELGLQENVAFIRACRKGESSPSEGVKRTSEEEQLSAPVVRPVSPLVSGCMCYHTAFTCSPSFILRAFELAEAEGVSVHMHASEGAYEPDYCASRYGARTFEFYERLGVAGSRMQASQCVQISHAELEIMAMRGVRVTHMPLSNCEVGGGIAPVPELLAAGVTVGLGSDGYITDMFEVMRGAFLIHKAARQDPSVMPADRVWHMATEGGALALGLEGVGRIAPGWQADLQLINADLPTPLRAWNLYEQLLLHRSRCDVRAVMVQGQWRVWNGLVADFDEEAARARLHSAALALWPDVR